MPSFKVIEEEIVDHTGQARFTVIGVGGGGGNAVEHMIRSGVNGVTFVCANTDKQALDRVSAQLKIQLGSSSTRGLGAGANPEVGRQSALEEKEAICEVLRDADMVFVTAGMGGGTGTGAAPVIAQIAREMGLLTVAVVTTPFRFEGNRRMQHAEKGVAELAQYVDSIITIPNEKLLSVYKSLSMSTAFSKVDDVLLTAVTSIFEVITKHGVINLDFADLKTVMSNRGYAMMGVGSARGEGRAKAAVEAAIRSPLLDNIRLENAGGLLINLTARDPSMDEISEIQEILSSIHEENEAQIFFGTVFEPTMEEDELRVTVIATGLQRVDSPAPNTHNTTAETPAINRRMSSSPTPEEPVVVAAATPTPTLSSVSIKDFLNNQQKKSES